MTRPLSGLLSRRFPRRTEHLGAVMVCLALSLFLSGCNNRQESDSRDFRLEGVEDIEPVENAIVVSFPALASWTETLLDGVAQPVVLFSGNLNPHSKELQPGQEEQLREAQAVVLMGSPIDAWISERQEISSEARVLGIFDDDGYHPWLDPKLARESIDRLAAFLAGIYSADANRIARNREELVRSLENLDAELTAVLEPYAGREILSTHQGLETFFSSYGMEIAKTLPLTNEAPTTQEIEKFRESAGRLSPPIVAVTPGDVSPLGGVATELSLISVLFDPVESGETGPSVYEIKMRHNALLLAQVLASNPVAEAVE